MTCPGHFPANPAAIWLAVGRTGYFVARSTSSALKASGSATAYLA